MSSFSRAVASVFVAGMIGGAGILTLVPAEADLQVATMRVPDPPAVPCKRQTWANADRGCLTWTVPQGEIAMPKVEPKPEPNFVSNSEPAPHQVAMRASADPVSPLPPRRIAAAPVAEPAPAAEAAAAKPQAPAVKYLAETAVEDVTAPVIAPLAVAMVAPVAVPAPPEPVVTPVVRARAERTEAPRTVRQVSHGVTRTAKAIVTTVSGRAVVIRPTTQQDVYYYAARAQLAAANGPVQR
jgi:hypothetical protein